MTTLRFSFCVKAATTLDAGDLDALTAGIEAYRKDKIGDRESEEMALDDIEAEVVSERAEIMQLVREQHPELFGGEAQVSTRTDEAATHKDPGEPAEPVTPAVVREAIKTGVQATDRRPSEMLADLMKQIDVAMATAPTAREASAAQRPTKDSFVRFTVPGDGDFKVVNTKESLDEFRKSAAASPGFKDRGTPAPKQSRTNNDGEYFGVDGGSGSASAAARAMLDEGEPLNALEALDAAGKPMMFGNGSKDSAIPYTDATPLTIKGVDGFVGRGWARKKGASSWWSFIHGASGSQIGEGGTKAEAIATATKVLADDAKRAKLESLMAAGTSADGGKFKGQDELRVIFVEGATKTQQGTFDDADTVQARAEAGKKTEADRDALYKAVMGNDDERPARNDWTAASITEFLNKAERAGKVVEALKLIDDAASEYVQVHAAEWKQKYDRRKPGAAKPQTGNAPEWQSEAEFGAVEQAKAIAEAEREVNRVKTNYTADWRFKSRAAALRAAEADLQAFRDRRPETFASDHLAAINRAIAQGKMPSAENIRRYNIPASQLPSAPAAPEPEAPAAQSAAPAPAAEPAAPKTLRERVAAVKERAAEKANTEDAGEELTYNRRNRIKSGLQWSDIATKNDALKVKEAVKQNVYPRPDYEALVAGGMEPMVAHIVKQVYDSIAAKPATRGIPTDADLQTYMAGIQRVMTGVMDWANDPASVAAWAQREARGAAAMLGRATSLSDLAAKPAGKSMLERAYPNGWRDARAEAIVLGGNKFYGALQPGYDAGRRASKAIDAGWPASQEAWQKRGLQVAHAEKVSVSYYEGKRTKTDEPYVSITYTTGKHRYGQQTIDGVDSKEAQSVKDAVAVEIAATEGTWLVLDKYGRMQGRLDTEEAATEVAREMVKRGGKEAGPDDSGIDVADAARMGPARRMEGENVSSDQVKALFGFKGVNFGTWMKGDSPALTAERQSHLNHTYDSFLDLAELFNVPPRAMSLNGMLGVAIGAQGTGGKKAAAAHFVPGVNEINLTRAAGAGSLGHEWGHALDHYFATQAGLSKAKEAFLTEHVADVGLDGYIKQAGKKVPLGSVRPEIVATFKAIVSAMNTTLETQAQVEARGAAEKAKAQRNVDGWLRSIKRDFMAAKVPEADFDKIAARISALDLGDGKIAIGQTTAVSPAIDELRALHQTVAGRRYSIDQIKGLSANVDHLAYLSKDREHVPQSTRTDYAANAARIDKEKGGKAYWGTNLEMFARAFDAFISDKLAEKAAQNSYLSHAGRTGETVPTGEERTAINAAIKTLVDTIQTRTDEAGNVAMFSRAQPWYSALTRGVEALPTKSADAAGWAAAIKGLVASGKAKQVEVEAMGLPEWLAMQQGKVTKDQVLEFLRANGVQVTETVLDGKDEDLPEPDIRVTDRQTTEGQWDEEAGEMVDGGLEELTVEERETGDVFIVTIDSDAGNVSVQGPGGRFIDVDAPLNRQTESDAIRAIEQHYIAQRPAVSNEAGQPTKFATYQLPGGTNYREVLLTLPAGDKDALRVERVDGKWNLIDRSGSVRGRYVDEAVAYTNKSVIEARSLGYRSNHWDQPNVLAHVRLNDRVDADGKRVLLVEELQSDWQAARRKQEKAIEKAVDADFNGIIKRMEAAGVLEVNCD